MLATKYAVRAQSRLKIIRASVDAMRKRFLSRCFIVIRSIFVSYSAAWSYCNKTGSYINSDGHVVKDPRCIDDSAGARYLCRDGSYSFSEHRQGACSRHGGVEKDLQ